MLEFWTQEEKGTEKNFNLQYDEIIINISINETRVQNKNFLVFTFPIDTQTDKIGPLIEGLYNSCKKPLEINISYDEFKIYFDCAISGEFVYRNPFDCFKNEKITANRISGNNGFYLCFTDYKHNLLSILKDFLENNVETAYTTLCYAKDLDRKKAYEIIGNYNIENTSSCCCNII